MRVNPYGDEIVEELLTYGYYLKTEDVAEVLALLLDRLGLEAIRTNATKHGWTEIQLRKQNENHTKPNP